MTVVDISGAMLELDRRVAAERGYSIRLFETSMDQLSMLHDSEFDIVIHPVSTCYLPNIRPVFLEVARVLRAEGVYISQHKQPTSLQATVDPIDGDYHIQHRYYRDTPIPSVTSTSNNSRRLRESGAIEFLHRWEEIIGGMCRAGFVIEDLSEPMHASKDAQAGTFADRASYIAPYVRVKAKRKGKHASDASLWLPKS